MSRALNEIENKHTDRRPLTISYTDKFITAADKIVTWYGAAGTERRTPGNRAD